ncbi:MAG: type II toxin-antitoxin system PemK/MazF family toxin [Nanoarchaeota archaeon]
MKFNFGDVILAEVQFLDTFEIKTRPVLVLFEEFGNIVVTGITSNLKMKGVSLTTKEGMPKESIIKINYIFTISEKMVKRYLFHLNEKKKNMVKNEILSRIK